MTKMLDRIQRMVRGEAPPPPIALFLGFRLTAIEPGRADLEMEVDGRFANPMGTLHGGVLCDIADAAMGLAYASTLDEGESFTSLEMSIHFLKPVWSTKLHAVGRVVKRGRTIGLAECDITDEGGSLVARAASTCMTLRGDRAKGR
jgi:uncharacterized protein (TIGR00369 family)